MSDGFARFAARYPRVLHVIEADGAENGWKHRSVRAQSGPVGQNWPSGGRVMLRGYDLLNAIPDII
jgi:hypothetical protein